MPYVEWDGSLAIGHEVIDQQHKVLIEIINRLFAAENDGVTPQKLRATFMELYRYSSYHFADEERLMSDIPHNISLHHKLEHERFIDDLNGLVEKSNSGDGRIGLETFRWLVAWLREHISVSDKLLASYLK